MTRTQTVGKRLLILFVLFILPGCGSGGEVNSNQTSVPVESFSTVSLSPANQSVNLGDMVIHTVEVRNLEQTYFSAFDISYDPEVIEYVDSSEGDFMNQAGTDPTSLQVALDNGIPGKLTVGLSRLGSIGDISGGGTLLTLRFMAVNPGITTLSFSPPMGFKNSENGQNPVNAWENGTVSVGSKFY